MKHIDAEKLRAEIEKNTPNHLMLMVYRDHILALIDSLQQEQPEVELEQEIIRYQREDMDRDTTMRDVARHFYELGCNSK